MDSTTNVSTPFGYVSATKLIVNALLLLSAVFSAFSISYIVYLRSNIPALVLARAFHLLLVPALLMIGLNITVHKKYIYGSILISVTATIVDLILHVLNFAFGYVFLNRIASLSALLASLIPTVILIVTIGFIGNVDISERYDRAKTWMKLLSQLSIIVATFGMLLAILNVFSPYWTLVWFLALPNWVVSEGFALSHRVNAGAAFSAAVSGFVIVATVVALFAFQTPPIDFITMLFVSVLDIPIGSYIALILTLVKLVLLLVAFILYGSQFAISTTIALNLSKKNGLSYYLPVLDYGESKRKNKTA